MRGIWGSEEEGKRKKEKNSCQSGTSKNVIVVRRQLPDLKCGFSIACTARFHGVYAELEKTTQLDCVLD